ncbi:ribonuclease III [Candidatus Nomurabacteria bacterium]|nr:ribonuclease III [Candidatus Nomurabacteria bacterium]
MKRERKKDQKLNEFAESIKVEFNDLDLLKKALTHRSYVNENREDQPKHNERLEFLGDAVLELIVSEHLFHNYLDKPEGDLTSFRAASVKTETLASLSRQLNVGGYLYMSKGEEETGGRDKDYLLANAFEAILGAIYLDQGYDIAKDFVLRCLSPLTKEIVEKRLDIDAKTKFQEIAQSLYKMTPIYKTVGESGPDHDKIFTMAAFIGEKEWGRGEGTSKQKAEEEAAQKAIEKIEKTQRKVVG